MIKLATLIYEDKASYMGDCRSIISHQTLFSDATQMAQAIERSKPITYDEFTALVDFRGAPRMFLLNIRKRPDWFTFGQHDALIWAYCSEEDTHFFFI